MITVEYFELDMRRYFILKHIYRKHVNEITFRVEDYSSYHDAVECIKDFMVKSFTDKDILILSYHQDIIQNIFHNKGNTNIIMQKVEITHSSTDMLELLNILDNKRFSPFFTLSHLSGNENAPQSGFIVDEKYRIEVSLLMDFVYVYDINSNKLIKKLSLENINKDNVILEKVLNGYNLVLDKENDYINCVRFIFAK